MSLLDRITSWWQENDAAPQPAEAYAAGLTVPQAAQFIHQLLQENEPMLAEAFTQADIELALDDRGWLVGGKRMMGELDPLSRQVMVNRSRYYSLRDPLVKQAVRLWTDYAFGATGVSWECENVASQSKINKFMKSRKNRRLTNHEGMRRNSRKLLIDGECFFGYFGDGTVRLFDPLQMTNIITDPDDEDLIVAYQRTTAGRDGSQPKTLYYKPWDYDGDTPAVGSGEIQPYYGGVATTVKDVKYVESCVMYHLAFDAFEKRGNPLISAASDWTREHRRFMTARVAIAEALSRFAFKGTVKGGQKIINSIRAKMESTFSQTGLRGGTEHQPPNAPGGIWLENEGIKLEATPRLTGASDAKTDADNLKLQVCAGTGIFQHYFGDPSTGNLATATAMELPMLKMFGAYQQMWKDAWRDMFSIVLEENPDDEPEDIDLTMPDIIDEDLQKLSTVVTSLVAAFPEAKVPQVMRRVLSCMDIEDLDEVMEDIAENKDTMDSQAEEDRSLDVAGKKQALDAGLKQNGEKPNGGAAGTNMDTAEAYAEMTKRLDKLIQLLS